MKKILLFFLTVFIFGDMYSQQIRFQRMYGDATYDYIKRALPSLDSNGYYILGSIDWPGTERAYMMRTDSLGDTLWTRVFSSFTGNGYCSPTDFVVMPDNGCLCVVGVVDAGAGSVYIRMNSLGDTLWTQPGYAGPYPMVRTPDSGFAYLGGNSIMKVDSNFNLQWWNQYEGGPSKGKWTYDGGFILIGSTQTYTVSGAPGDQDVYLVKTDSMGLIQWTKVFAIPGDTVEQFGDVAATLDGGYIVVFSTRITPYTPKWVDIVAVKTDGLGNVQWTKQYGGARQDEAYEVVSTQTGYTILGFTMGAEIPQAAIRTLIMKIDLNGNYITGRQYGSTPSDPSDNNASHLQRVIDGGYILYGLSGTWADGFYDGWFIKLDVNLTSGCNEDTVMLPSFVPTLLTGVGGPSSPMTYPLNLRKVAVSTWSTLTPSILCSSDTTGSWLGISNYSIENNISIYPNPSSGIFTLSSKISKGQIEVYNVLGAQVFSSLITSNSTTINLSTQPAGVYFVRLASAEGKSYSQKIVIE